MKRYEVLYADRGLPNEMRTARFNTFDEAFDATKCNQDSIWEYQAGGSGCGHCVWPELKTQEH